MSLISAYSSIRSGMRAPDARGDERRRDGCGESTEDAARRGAGPGRAPRQSRLERRRPSSGARPNAWPVRRRGRAEPGRAGSDDRVTAREELAGAEGASEAAART
ncbi:hypothetical protein BE15_16195 [Sorangium cellulosum]|uniref:Uncharacterized protein n=1 Tax=Sorangium cellulosum TaxID=56 RepID=A0A150QS56_SORCE|nr:hypothetical protein BE15_16195 [Sorangium cellulosum]